MVLISSVPVSEKKYKLAPSYQQLTEAEIISRCLSGVLGRKTLYFESENPSRLLKAELIEVKAQAAKTKWAVRGVAFLLILVVYCGFRIVVQITS